MISKEDKQLPAATKKFSVEQLALAVNGTLRLSEQANANERQNIFAITSLDKASIGNISFCLSLKLIPTLKDCQASVLLIDERFIKRFEKSQQWPKADLIIVPHVRIAMAKLTNVFERRTQEFEGIHSTALIHPTAQVHPSAKIGAFSVIGEECTVDEGSIIHHHVVLYQGVIVGKDSEIYSHCVLEERVEIGDQVVIQSGVCIGSRGYGFEMDENNQVITIEHFGSVSIGNHVEIGAMSMINRGTFNDTRIGHGSKIGHQVHIAHNALIGNHVGIGPNTEMAGSVTIADGVVVGPASKLAQGITLQSGCVIQPTARVLRSVKSGEVMAGMIPAADKDTWEQSWLRLPHKVEMIKNSIQNRSAVSSANQ